MTTRRAWGTRLLSHVVRLLLFGICGGALVFWFWLYEQSSPDNLRDFISSISVGTAYTFVMAFAQSSSGRQLSLHVPLRSTHAVWLHVGVQATVTLVSFLAATLAFALILGWNTSLLWSQGMISIGIVAFIISLIGNGIGYLSAFYKQLREAENATLEAELRALRAQINPHFLFNSLNSIAALIRTRPTEAEAVTEDLADLFRYSLRASQQPSVTLGEELASVRMYLAIERARFRDRLDIIIDVPPELNDVEVPSLLLQPLVENAIKHGMGRTTEPCTVHLQASYTSDTVTVTVADTGPGFDTTDVDTLFSRGTGLGNIHQRLQHFFGPQAEMRVASHSISLHVPVRDVVQAADPEPLQAMSEPYLPPSPTT